MLSPLLFTILLEVLSRPGFPEQLPYADDLALVSETLEDLKGRLEVWKGALGSKGSRVNIKKTKMTSIENAAIEGFNRN